MKVQPSNKHYFVVAVEEEGKLAHSLYNVQGDVVASKMKYEQAHILCKIMEQAYSHQKAH